MKIQSFKIAYKQTSTTSGVLKVEMREPLSKVLYLLSFFCIGILVWGSERKLVTFLILILEIVFHFAMNIWIESKLGIHSEKAFFVNLLRQFLGFIASYYHQQIAGYNLPIHLWNLQTMLWSMLYTPSGIWNLIILVVAIISNYMTMRLTGKSVYEAITMTVLQTSIGMVLSSFMSILHLYRIRLQLVTRNT